MKASPRYQPELDPGFLPASLWTRAYEARCEEEGGREVALTVARPDGTRKVHCETVLAAGEGRDECNFLHIERTVKFLLWAFGGSRVEIAGAPELCPGLAACYAPGGARSFDADFVKKVFGEELVIAEGQMPESFADVLPAGMENLGRHLGGNRIGFDLGGSDRKCAAVIDGEVVFSEEIPWDPYFEKDPEYHYRGIMDSIQRAAAHLPQVDAIGGSSAGVYVNNRVRVASLFRGVPEELFEDKVRDVFFKVNDHWHGVPMQVVNDGDVTALAGSMSIGDGAVLGVAMGTSLAAGYVDPSGAVTPWLSELAFVPVDYQDDAPADEWSGDSGCGVQYFSQQGVSRLIPASGLEIDMELGKPEQLVEVQKRMEAGDDRAAAIYRTLGVELGYAIPHLARFYEVRHLLLLGRVMSGAGGEVILHEARKVLDAEFPELAETIEFATPDEKMKRHGQAIAAASIPSLS